MTPLEHAAWTEAAAAELARRPEVVGVVGMGSTAVAERVDEFSDHDLAVVVMPGAESAYSGVVDWMPLAHRVVAVGLEHHGGACAIYDDGHLVEWGVATVGGLAEWVADDYRVLFDRGGVAEAMAVAATRSYPANDPDLARDVALFHAALIKGVGRVRRGERLSGGRAIRADAVDALLRAVRAASTTSASRMFDRLDGLRRFERVFPEVAARVDAALSREPEAAARELFDTAQDVLGVGPGGIPTGLRDGVATALAWSVSD